MAQDDGIVTELRKRANDAENWADSYEGNRQGEWLKSFAAAFRNGADRIEALEEGLRKAEAAIDGAMSKFLRANYDDKTDGYIVEDHLREAKAQLNTAAQKEPK